MGLKRGTAPTDLWNVRRAGGLAAVIRYCRRLGAWSMPIKEGRWRDEPGLGNDAMSAVRLSSLWMGWAGKAGCWSVSGT